MNFTLVVPNGTTNHGNPHLLCTPPKWYDVALFYFANYFAHAATVVSYPGQGTLETALAVVKALLLPGTGVFPAAETTLRHPALIRGDALAQANRARALCMVVKSRPRRLCFVNNPRRGIAALRPNNFQLERLDAKHRWWECKSAEGRVSMGSTIHGEFKLPRGYDLNYVPLTASLEFAKPGEVLVDPGTTTESMTGPMFLDYSPRLESTYNFPKLFVSLAQATWACVTLYRARGDQIERYGYAAFGLTVAPYACMSIINIVANLLAPDYPSIFLVRTPSMDEAEAKGGYCSGELHVKINPESAVMHDEYTYSAAESGILGVLLSLTPLAIIGGLSHFRNQKSTSIQRGFTMSWVVFGIFTAVNSASVYSSVDYDWSGQRLLGNGRFSSLGYAYKSSLVLRNIYFMAVWGVASIGGMVVVGKMIAEYGICTWI
ncbi:uncharacterized protein LY89DRAFT_778229 [Mollisia scopiformis]|uniref:Uncharacterized protein n=1 Tax=Mollisia scopiformis TaxID=149040 RepID=A0A194XNX0_MOLSC|nr:uncharacterized protein LY89DRAFT_778229 [Mollisia scopiformis]KUJ21861.1 hypothetical protein LY89DRAFT_778229 [Mollisia scopiformis]